jgi:2-(1,2-epoxy-1,2-dihydrophenyl)acetyl-CoA isomerase
MLRLTGLDCPTVIAVQGAGAGAGLSLLLACDLALAADDARFVFAYDRIATTPDGGLSWTLPRAVGLRRAMSIALSGESVGASRALEFGLVCEVVPAALLQERAGELAGRIARGPSRAHAATRRLMLGGQDRGFAEQLVAERDSFCHQAGSEDFRGAIEAFFERRKPEYRGR